jgi:hypothetical protein
MTEIVVAVFETPSSADAAVEDLTAARIPSAAVRTSGGQQRGLAPHCQPMADALGNGGGGRDACQCRDRDSQAAWPR